MAKKLQIPLISISTLAWTSVVFESMWDHYLFPMVVSKGIRNFSQPIYPDKDLPDESIGQGCVRVGEAMKALETQTGFPIGTSGKQSQHG